MTGRPLEPERFAARLPRDPGTFARLPRDFRPASVEDRLGDGRACL
ncbi:hypothetical protein [Streptomyces sp. NBC_01451]|nr:hypothetical protein [Streptomyces sp. NBC_01451]